MKRFCLLMGALLTTLSATVAQPARDDIYHDGWIDLNKNGRKDI